LYISYIVSVVFTMTERAMKTQLIIAVAIAAIIVLGIGSHNAFAIKAKKNSFQDGYKAGFAAGKKDRINGNEFDNKPPKDRSDAYDEGYKRGYEDGWSSVHHFDPNSVAAASSSALASDDDHGRHKHKDSAAASSSTAAAAGGASAASSSAAAAAGGSAAAASSSASASS
jgi:hypothetical protein